MNKFFYTLSVMVWAGIATTFAQTSQTQKLSVYFDYKNATVTDSAKVQLSHLVKPVLNQAINNYQILLAGVADSVGTNANNYDLAKLRATRVKAYLAKLGVESNRMRIDVLGELPANNAQEHAQNRRVEVTLQWQAPVMVAKTPDKKPDYGDISELLLKLQKPPQSFTIDNSRDTILVGKQRTVVLIKANSLYLKKGQRNQPITIHLKEYYTYTDMILANLTTTSNKKLLETGGMVFIKAIQNGKELRLASGKNILIGLPTRSLQSNMQAFNGRRDNNGNINWRLNRRGWVRGGRGGLSCYTTEKSCWFLRLFSRKKRARYRLQQNRATKADRLLLADELKREENFRKTYYILSNNRLGWVNCDTFANMPQNQLAKVKFKYKSKYSLNNTSYFLALHQRCTLVSGYQGHLNYINFMQLPKQETATLVALQYRGGKALMATKQVMIGQPIKNDLAFTAHSIDDARTAMQKLLTKHIPNQRNGK